MTNLGQLFCLRLLVGLRLLPWRFVFGEGALQIPPLRFASVGMTNLGQLFCLRLLVGLRLLPWRFVFGEGALQIPPLRFGRDDKFGAVVLFAVVSGVEASSLEICFW
jgi:hypothetical protein